MHPTQPTFKTSRLLLRPRTVADTDSCLAMDRDPEVTRFVHGPWSDAPAHQNFIESRTRGPYLDGLGYWTIALLDDPEAFLGWVLLIPNDGIGPEIEIGWRLRRQAWGQGLATEAAAPVLHHAFATVGLAEVVAEIDTRNAASQRVAEKLGLRLQGEVQHSERCVVRFSRRREEIDGWRQVEGSAPHMELERRVC